ncbi:MAG: LysM peptidoglycan-binding domain-containing protein [Sedimentisphaerales bacterium]|nr:LysM peptidoglycan-binding domain-containing protein [Sedimentisphaerales bacterium]
MTKEAKVGLLLGLLLIIGIAVVLRGVHRDGQQQNSDELRRISQEYSPSSGNTAVTQGVQRLSNGTTNSPTRSTPPAANRSQAPAPSQIARNDTPAGSQSTLSANQSYAPTSVIATQNNNDVRYTSPLPSSRSTDDPGLVHPMPGAIDNAAQRAVASASQSNTPTIYGGNSPSSSSAGTTVVNAQSSQRRIHVVRDGDDLSKIALEVYGPVEGRRWINVLAIYEANNDILTSMDVLRVGQSLRIPPLMVTGVPASNASSNSVQAISQVNTPAASAPSNSGQVYVVREGDSLWRIAQRQLGDGNRHEEILALNRDRISDPGRLRVGQSLRMPAGAAASTTVAQQQPQANTTASVSTRSYTVREGDSLWSIAAQHLGNGERYHEIASLNSDVLSNENSLRTGLVLRLP